MENDKELNCIVLGSSQTDTLQLSTRYGDDAYVGSSDMLYPFKLVNFKLNGQGVNNQVNLWNLGGGFHNLDKCEKLYEITYGLILMYNVCDFHIFENMQSAIYKFTQSNPGKKIMIVGYVPKNYINRIITDEEGSQFADENDCKFVEVNEQNTTMIYEDLKVFLD